jgi:formylglycine-generating enzyme required for sulfatase activity
MAFVPGGTFQLGSPLDEPGREDDEGPQRGVRVSAFWMGVHEVTHDEFALFRHRRLDADVGLADDGPFDADAVTRPSPPYEDPTHGMGQEGNPAVGMTRLAALHYARWLSEKTGRLYRLPTEAEWEYACEAGRGGVFGFGDDPRQLERYSWVETNSVGTYHPGGLKEPNPWGLRDMHGNVAEWVMDEYDAASYETLAGDLPQDPMAGRANRGRGVVRGGAFDDGPDRVRCAERFPETSAWKRRDPQVPKSRWWNTDSPHVGFRLVSPARAYGMDDIRAYWAALLEG